LCISVMFIFIPCNEIVIPHSISLLSNNWPIRVRLNAIFFDDFDIYVVITLMSMLLTAAMIIKHQLAVITFSYHYINNSEDHKYNNQSAHRHIIGPF
jgi:hypothetical protein